MTYYVCGLKLESWLLHELNKANCCLEQSRSLVTSMVETSTRGVDSHGVFLFPHYLRAMKAGRVNRNPDLRLDKKGSFFRLDADNAFGHYAGDRAVEELIADAAKNGISACAVMNSSHFGAASYFTLKAARRGYVGLSFCNADSLVRQPASNERFLGTNPISISFPNGTDEPVCLDMATSQGNWNKIKNFARNGQQAPDGLIRTKNGFPTNDPNEAYSLDPIGDYKGFGLGVAVDFLCALFTNSPFSHEIPAMYDSDLSLHRKLGQFYVVINPAHFVEAHSVFDRVKSYANVVHSLPALQGSFPKMPGDPERDMAVVRKESGIPFPDFIYDEFLSINADFKNCLIDENT